MAVDVAIDLDGAFSLWEHLTHWRNSHGTEKEGSGSREQELWQKLEDVYDRLGELFEPDGDGDELDEDE